MISRILARVLAKRLREWTQENGILDDNQSGFRPGRATADATQLIIRIQEDMSFIKRRRKALKIPTHLPSDPVGRLLDLEKAYPRVSKPALWEILRRHGMRGTFLNCLMDLHETTACVVKGKEGDSYQWIPQRGLREGCPTSPVLLNVFHQSVLQAAERKRNEKAVSSGQTMGIAWNWIDDDKLPSSEQTGKFNSVAKRTDFSISLFADDTTVLWCSSILSEFMLWQLMFFLPNFANYCNNCFMKCPVFKYLVFEILNANLIAINNCGHLFET